MKLKIVAILAIIGVSAAGFGFYQFNKTHASTNSLQSEVMLDAVALIDNYEKDESAADKLYLDKVVQIKGMVEKVEQNDGTTKIYLHSDNPMSSVICQFESSPQTLPVIGDEVSIKGICTGYLMDVVLIRSVLI